MQVQCIRKNIFIVLKLMVYSIHISSLIFQAIDHKITVPLKVDYAISVLFSRGWELGVRLPATFES